MIGSAPRQARTGPSTLKRSEADTAAPDLPADSPGPGDSGEEPGRRCSGTRGTPAGTPSMQSP
ncbi:hypothetical protein GCM10010423_46650 [Streptomyces levis]|uniref:Uncharacterized protein n=1 Tax=Streptomyces levis TaxID=285566 RepID=A0ABP6B9N1_9ACTN